MNPILGEPGATMTLTIVATDSRTTLITTTTRINVAIPTANNGLAASESRDELRTPIKQSVDATVHSSTNDGSNVSGPPNLDPTKSENTNPTTTSTRVDIESSSGLQSESIPTPSAHDADSNSPTRKETTSGVIAGAVVGAMSCAMAVQVGLVFYRRRRQAHLRSRTREQVSPYSDERISKGYSRKELTEPSLEQPQDAYIRQSAPIPLTYQIEEERYPRSPKDELRRVRYHNDSGWRPVLRAPTLSDDGGTGVVDMPPRYYDAV
ncbi:hypothetical protein VNI00_017892 [Paramarasmius palmivorus]|uniref:Uncharacterized protein n=1 Tax=Paramarasmius palmivorus TaxID=297713 RepID=A0AAW0B2E2_9AGAR